MSGFVDDLRWRGLIYQTTDEAVFDLLEKSSLTVYDGFDPSADSLHVGNLLGLITLRRFQLAEHRPIVLAGGGTGIVGDPGGRSEERNLLTEEQIKANLKSVRPQLEKFLDFSRGSTQAVLVNNLDWLGKYDLLDFLRDVGKHFTVNQMVTKDSVRDRLENREQGISFTEFSYMLLQAADFLHLFEKFDCKLQIGGSDQWGNITAGVELIRRRLNETAYGLTMPLLLKPDGTKYGKTAAGSEWLDRTKTSPFAMYQFFVQSDDAQVGTLLRRFTFLTREEIEALEKQVAEKPAAQEAQKQLALEMVSLVHGPGEAKRIADAARVLFSEELVQLDEATLLEVFEDAPSTKKSRNELSGSGVSLIDALVDSKLVSSKSEARKTIEQGGASVNNKKVSDIESTITEKDLLHNRHLVLRKGKRDYHLITFS